MYRATEISRCLICVVPADRAGALLAPLREHFAGEPRVAVLVEQRALSSEREPASLGGARRHQRAPIAERDPKRALPPELYREARGVRLVQRLEPLGRVHEDTDTIELARLSRVKDPAAVSELWWRFSERVHVRLRRRVGELAAATATPEVLGCILDDLDRYDPEQQPLTAWLDAVVDRYADGRVQSPY